MFWKRNRTDTKKNKNVSRKEKKEHGNIFFLIYFVKLRTVMTLNDTVQLKNIT